jgi:hypothetical protein
MDAACANPAPTYVHDRGEQCDAPAWITPSLIERTLRIWQPFYKEAQLTPAHAVQILVGMGRLFAALEGS